MKTLDQNYEEPAKNLACDEILLNEVDSKNREATLRFWEPQLPFVVIGYGNNIHRECLVESCKNNKIQIFRRFSGGGAVLAAQSMGADLAYIGSAFIATDEANADNKYKEMIALSSADDIIYTNLFTGVHGNYLKPSIKAQGLDPENLENSDSSKMNFSSGASKPKNWKDIWGSGQGISAVKSVGPAKVLIERLKKEYKDSKNRILNNF